jgi:hypothetical protein
LRSDGNPDGFDLVFLERLDPVRGMPTNPKRPKDIVQAPALGAQAGDCQWMFGDN